MTRFLFPVWQLRVSCCWTPSLTIGWVCNLLVQLLLGLSRAITLGSKSRRTQTIFYCLIWDSPNLEGQVPVFISPRNRVAQLHPQALGSLFVTSYDSQGLLASRFRFRLVCDRRSVGQSVLVFFRRLLQLAGLTCFQVQVQVSLRPMVSWPVCLGVGPPLGPMTRILLLSNICNLHVQGPSLTRGWVCNLFIQLVVTLQSKSRRTDDHILPSHLRQYVTVSYKTPPTWRARSPYLYPLGIGWPTYTPGYWVPFLSPLTTRKVMAGVL
jgi:hypothetical protein